MILFLTALGILFIASLAGFVIIRILTLRGTWDPVAQAWIKGDVPALGTVHLPVWLWFSTLLMLLSSVTIHSAVDAVRRERQIWLRRWLVVTMLLAAGFLLIQTPAMADLLRDYYHAAQGKTPVFGLIFFLILLHAAHVVGGVLPLGYITFKAHQGRYDHEYHVPVSNVAMYWHFLDVVWLIMFAVLLVAS